MVAHTRGSMFRRLQQPALEGRKPSQHQKLELHSALSMGKSLDILNFILIKKTLRSEWNLKTKSPPLPIFIPTKSAFPTAFHKSLRSLLWWEAVLTRCDTS